MRKSFCSCTKLTNYYKELESRSWIEKLLIRFIPHFDIVKTVNCQTCDGTGEVPWRPTPVYIDQDFESDTCYDCDDGKITSLYLRRFYVWRSAWIGKNWGDLYIHKIARSDDDPDPHNHPWDFRTFVLKGGYTDESYSFTETRTISCVPELATDWVGKRGRHPEHDDVVKAGDTRFRPWFHIHRVILPDENPAWTLVATSGYRSKANGDPSWCFVTEDRKVPWREYLGLNAEDEHGS